MAYRARAVTDANGKRAIYGSFFLSDMTAQPVVSTKKEIWKYHIKNRFKTTLVELVKQPRFNLLASRLINVEEFKPDTEVKAGYAPGVRMIRIGKIEFRERASFIYTKGRKKPKKAKKKK